MPAGHAFAADRETETSDERQAADRPSHVRACVEPSSSRPTVVVPMEASLKGCRRLFSIAMAPVATTEAAATPDPDPR